MKKLLYFIIFFLNFQYSYSEIKHDQFSNLFNIGKMISYNKEFTLYFKPRDKAILARGEKINYIKDFPQDLYIYYHLTQKDFPLISYDWFPREVKKITNYYKYPVFPEDFAYYLLEDNNTLVMINTKKNFNKNFEFDIKSRKLKFHDNLGKINFIISTYAQNCGFKDISKNFECNFYKPLISNYLFN